MNDEQSPRHEQSPNSDKKDDVKSPKHLEGLERMVLSVLVESYSGDVDDQGLFHGEAKASFKGGHTYTGQFEHGLMHGQGVYTWPHGTSYTGGLDHNSITGVGKYDFPDGSYYVVRSFHFVSSPPRM
jgi:hypothetical protein